MKYIALALAASSALLLAACDDAQDGDPTDTQIDSDVSDVALDGSGDAAGPDVGEDVTDVALDLTIDAEVPDAYPDPGAWPANRGPGGPTRSFSDEELFVKCAFLSGGERDITQHHNLVSMFDGYLVMPWAPEWGGGGLTFFDVSDPCEPVTVGTGYSPTMRETHSFGFSHHAGGRWTVVDQISAPLQLDRGGIQFWDISDSHAPEAVADVEFEGFLYPDAYARVVLSVFWQAPYVYAASGDRGINIVDATDPRNPVVVGHYIFDPVLRAGHVSAIGNLLFVGAASGSRHVFLDISDPANPVPIPGGDYHTVDEHGVHRENYFSNLSGGYSWHARKDAGGGLFVYDVSDPTSPVKAGQFSSLGSGGYVFVKDDLAFVGESSSAAIYDVSDMENIVQVARLNLEGDLDTVTPIGNMALLSVDEGAPPGEGSAFAPFTNEPDTRPPVVLWAWPPDGATELATTSRVGVSFNEFVDPMSAWEGSVRVYEADTDPATTRVEGIISTQETIVNFWPVDGLRPNTTYVLEIPAGGIVDFNGNAIEEPFEMRFSTGP